MLFYPSWRVFYPLIIQLLLICSIFVVDLQASPYQAKIEGINQIEAHAGNIRGWRSSSAWKSGPRRQNIEALVLESRIPRLGKVKLSLSKQINPVWPATISYAGGVQKEDDLSNLILLQGAILTAPGQRGTKKKSGASAALIGNDLEINFLGRKRPVTLKKLRGVSTARVQFTLSSKLRGKTCATEDSASLQGQTLAMGAYALPLTQRIIELATDADTEWYNLYGSSSNSKISSAINTAEAIYERDLNLIFDLQRQNYFASGSPYSSTNPALLLSEFRNYTDSARHLGSRDQYHLFTGKDLDSSVIGISYISSLCRDLSDRGPYAITSFDPQTHSFSHDAETAIIFAHETGHTLGAAHDNSQAGIMEDGLGNTLPDSFSDISKSQISAFITQYGSCLSESMQATPTPTRTPTRAQTPTGSSSSSSGSSSSSSGGGDGGGSTVGGGGGAGFEEDDGPTPINVTATLSDAGSFTASITIDPLDTTCTGTLKVGPRLSTVSWQGKLALSFAAIANKNIEVSNVPALKTRERVYLQAYYACSGANTRVSNIVVLRPKRQRKQGININAWLRRFAAAVMNSDS